MAENFYVIELIYDGWVEVETECVELEFNANTSETYVVKNNISSISCFHS